MVPCNRAIYRGHGLKLQATGGFEAVLTAADGLRPVTTDDGIYSMRRPEHKSDLMPVATMDIDTTPISGKLSDFPPVRVELASGSEWEPLWDRLVERHHYLGYRKLLGRRIKYMAFLENRPVAALSWSAPALKMAARDCFIGWSPIQRKRHLHQVAGNSRFLIPTWVRIKNLASHVMALNIARLESDWLRHFNHRLLLLETFIDGRYFDGACYKASNWLHVGRTRGSTKQGKGYRYHGFPKEVYLYVIEKNFRDIIDCQRQPAPVFDRPPRTKIKVEELAVLLEHCKWHPGLTADLNLTEDDIKKISEQLIHFHELFHGCFGRVEHRRLGLAYMSGLMSNAGAKSIEPIALEFLGKESVRSLQMFMKNYRWDHVEMLRAHRSMLSSLIASPNGMITIDPSDFAKKGLESVGVSRQYCGALGKVENCQTGVFVGYTSEKGYGLLNCRLYMPKSWFTDEQEQRRKANLVPEDLGYKTKQEIAIDLIREIDETGLFPSKWIGADAAFGEDIDFLNSLPEDRYYFAAIKSNTQVFIRKPRVGVPAYKGRGRRPTKIGILSGQPKPRSVSEIAKGNRLSWEPVVVAEGAKGPITAQVARIRVYMSRDGLPVGKPQWLFFRKNGDGEIKYAVSNAPKETSFSELIKASIMRWPIEQCFQEGKGQVGMDSYEHRSWPAWHRHMAYVFLALHFMLRIRLLFKKNSSVDAATGQEIAVSTSSSQITEHRGNHGDC
jgi:SRSO17 transposase